MSAGCSPVPRAAQAAARRGPRWPRRAVRIRSSFTPAAPPARIATSFTTDVPLGGCGGRRRRRAVVYFTQRTPAVTYPCSRSIRCPACLPFRHGSQGLCGVRSNVGQCATFPSGIGPRRAGFCLSRAQRGRGRGPRGGRPDRSPQRLPVMATDRSVLLLVALLAQG